MYFIRLEFKFFCRCEMRDKTKNKSKPTNQIQMNFMLLGKKY